MPIRRCSPPLCAGGRSRARAPLCDGRGARATERSRTPMRPAVSEGDRRGARVWACRRSRTLADAWEQLGEALRSMGEPEAAEQALTKRDGCWATTRSRRRVCHSHGGGRRASASLTAAVRWLRRGSGGPTGSGRRCGGLPGADPVLPRRDPQPAGSLGEAISACRQAIVEAEAVGELGALAHACYALDWALVESGQREQATHSWRALELFEQLGDPEHESAVLNNLGMFAYFDGRWDDAVALYRASRRVQRPRRAAGRSRRHRLQRGEILSDQGRLDEAETHLQRARRVWSATGERQAVAFVDVLLRRLAARRGLCPDGARTLEEAPTNCADPDRCLCRLRSGAGRRGPCVRGRPCACSESRGASWTRPSGTGRCCSACPGSRWRGSAGQTRPRGELRSALATAREDGSTTRSPPRSRCSILGAAEADMLRDRNEISGALKIERLPVPVLR